MKICKICGAEIVRGVNGCDWYDECFSCRPIHYPAKPREVDPYASFEALDYLENRCLDMGGAYD